ncbi:hypothetical protein [Actinomadura rudentiformis]|uniref:Uncharacterized protein n=1 Tax=Actinomadura rudentiformis TaxID=359158 RepID=A0A6H9YVJ7_9ACTN|nr:hypothetical protein [Actinomadura rudentiformis]KAB2347809.1 hypothetical protein F8566_18120 [Actinomadura rudentiformis]
MSSQPPWPTEPPPGRHRQPGQAPQPPGDGSFGQSGAYQGVRRAKQDPFEQTRPERDPYEQTRPDPRQDERAEGDEGEETPPRREWLRGGERRFIEVIVLVCLASLLLGLRWVDSKDAVRKTFQPPEQVTSVARGAPGVLADIEWRVTGRTAGRALGERDPEVAELRLTLTARPLNAAGMKAIRGYGISYRVLDAEGREWDATGLPRPGAPYQVTVRATVPRSKADSLTLEVLAPRDVERRGAPRPSLRFAP